MPRMLDLIRASALTSHQMMSASKGALRLPDIEMVEILVYLAEHNKIFGEAARLTLAGWDEAAAKTICANPAAPKEVLDYWLAIKNIRPVLLPILIENPSVSMTTVSGLAVAAKGELADALIASPRIANSRQVLQDLAANHHLSGAQAARVQALIKGDTAIPNAAELAARVEAAPAAIDEHLAKAPALEQQTVALATHSATQEPLPQSEPAAAALTAVPPASTSEDDPDGDNALLAFFAEHATEIAAEANKPFQPIGGVFEEHGAHEEPKAMAAAASATSAPSPVPAKTAGPKHFVNPHDEERGSVLQKIAKLDIKGRIQLAMKGTKEERSLLVRDGTKIVALAVLDSPKISDGEVEKFATQKNVLEAVLRSIPMKRRFAKNYAVVRNLVFNPRTPLDVGLGLMKNLLVADLRNLAGNKEVSETVRKLALRMFKQKSEPNNKN